MGISHEYHSTSHRARHGGVSGKLRLAGAVLAILVLAYAITAILENGASAKDAQSEPVASGIAQDILAPLPMQGEAADSDSSGDSTAPDGSGDAQAVTLETFGPARQDAAAAVVKAYDASVIRQPSCGQVDLNYFADAAFLGDSLTVGFSDYQINLGGALVCGYTGVGPDAIVNRTAVKSSVRGEEIALDVLAAAQPKKLYILLGTNTLTTLGASDRFLAYYGQMLDMLREALGPDCVIYVESVPPVRPKAAAEKPGLASDVLRGVNEQLAQLAASKGHVVVDGFHRRQVAKTDVQIRESLGGYLPVVRLDKSIEDRITSTVRHNMARGTHQVELTARLVTLLRNHSWTNERIGTELGMEPDEVLRLKQMQGLAEAFADREFSRAWDMCFQDTAKEQE